MFLLTDQGREKIRNLIRKEIKNSVDNEFLFKKDDRVLLKEFIDKIKRKLDY